MISGGINTEYLAINEISAWMNACRGCDEVSQSGVRIGSHEYLETLLDATRNEQYGRDENSIETLVTRYFSSHTRLGNYAPFRIYSNNKLSEIISLREGQSIAWPEESK